MYHDYIRSILPIPILDIKVAKNNNYRYKITTYQAIADELETRKTIEKRVYNCKRIKSIEGWYSDSDINKKYAIIEFTR